mmetsp:Transcript_56481/g.82881  ORF Transcript_56481/g.82881 Transcript_56481/m.82881 type:complete len:151 (+) Transcript_56481:69-521(+)
MINFGRIAIFIAMIFIVVQFMIISVSETQLSFSNRQFNNDTSNSSHVKVSLPKSVVMITGGAGYIGSHAALYLLERDWNVLVVDDMSRGSPVVLQELFKFPKFQFENVDISDPISLDTLQIQCGPGHAFCISCIRPGVLEASRSVLLENY